MNCYNNTITPNSSQILLILNHRYTKLGGEKFSPGTLLTQAASFSLTMLSANFLPAQPPIEHASKSKKEQLKNQTTSHVSRTCIFVGNSDIDNNAGHGGVTPFHSDAGLGSNTQLGSETEEIE